MADNKVIYSMIGVGKIVPPNRVILRDISLSYFYGAKIGVLGLNGAGKSSLLRILGAADHHHIAGNGSAGLSHHRFNCSFALEHCRRVTDDNLDPLRFEGTLEKGRHLRIVQFIEQHPALDQGHRQASLPQ